MHCNEVEKWIEALADNEISSLLMEEVEMHVSNCRSCGRILQNTRTLRSVLRNSLPLVSAPSRLDARLMEAFYRTQQKRETSTTSTWKSAFFQHMYITKPIFSLLIVLVAVLLGLAFQLGRLSVSRAQKVLDKQAPLAKIIEIAVTKPVDLPVIKEKLVTRYVYLNKQNRDSERMKTVHNPQMANVELISSIVENGYITQTSLKGFQPAAEIKIGVRKGGKDNER